MDLSRGFKGCTAGSAERIAGPHRFPIGLSNAGVYGAGVDAGKETVENNPPMSDRFDCLIVGTGPAGLGAAFQLTDEDPSLSVALIDGMRRS